MLITCRSTLRKLMQTLRYGRWDGKFKIIVSAPAIHELCFLQFERKKQHTYTWRMKQSKYF